MARERGIPDNKGLGHRQAAVRRDQLRSDQIRETDRITGEETFTLQNKQIPRQCCFRAALPI